MMQAADWSLPQELLKYLTLMQSTLEGAFLKNNMRMYVHKNLTKTNH